jgi:hypothetical protein
VQPVWVFIGLRVCNIVSFFSGDRDDIIPAHKVAREADVLPRSDDPRVLERPDYGVAELFHVTHVDATGARTHRLSPCWRSGLVRLSSVQPKE